MLPSALCGGLELPPSPLLRLCHNLFFGGRIKAMMFLVSLTCLSYGFALCRDRLGRLYFAPCLHPDVVGSHRPGPSAASALAGLVGAVALSTCLTCAARGSRLAAPRPRSFGVGIGLRAVWKSVKDHYLFCDAGGTRTRATRGLCEVPMPSPQSAGGSCLPASASCVGPLRRPRGFIAPACAR